MMLQLARRGRLSTVVPSLQGFFPTAAAPVFAATISSTAASRESGNSSNESIRTNISRSSTKELKAQLAARSLWTSRTKLDLAERLSRSPKKSTRQEKHVTAAKHVEEVPEMPDPREFTEKHKAPIRVPLTPDNKLARYHRYEVVPEVAPPLKPSATTILPDASNVLDAAADTLANVLESISVEVKAHKSQSRYEKENKEVKDSVKGIMQSIAHGITPKEGSALHTMVRFPVDLVKDMVEDVFSGGKQFSKEEKQEKKEKSEDEGPQTLTEKERTALYTIGGLSVVWYFFGY